MREKKKKKRKKNTKESKKGKNACNIVSYRYITSNFKCHEISLLIVMYLYGNSKNEWNKNNLRLFKLTFSIERRLFAYQLLFTVELNAFGKYELWKHDTLSLLNCSLFWFWKNYKKQNQILFHDTQCLLQGVEITILLYRLSLT